MSIRQRAAALLRDRLWRLNNLYYITDKKGRCVKFRMTPEQLAYYESEWHRNIILKARQLGFTTEVCIMQLDAALFMGEACAMIAHTRHDAQRLFRNKTQYAYARLPDAIKAANPLAVENSDEYVFEKGGSVTISTSFRGGTLQRLHVSEFGKICAKFPDKAREIVTGAFEAVAEGGVITLESTAEGRSGYFFDYCQEAEKLALAGLKLSPLEWRFFFFPWWKNPEYSTEPRILSDRMLAYFAKLEQQGIHLTDGQKTWYSLKERVLGTDIKREYPSTPAEAFEQAIEGAYYAQQLADAYADGRIAPLPDNDHLPVYTFWDLGVSDSTAIWFVRRVGDEFHVIDYYENSGEGLNHYIGVLVDRGYDYAAHVAPHDVANRQLGAKGAKSLLDLARDGYEIDGETYSLDFEVLPRSDSIATDIEQVRRLLPRCCIDSVQCEQGLRALAAYRKQWDDKAGGWKDRPLHDWSSHAADAFRYFATYFNQAEAATTLEIGMFR